MSNTRKPMIFGLAVAGSVVALGSAAFACTTFKGRMEVTAGAGTSKAWGKNSGMTHCPAPNDPKSVATVPTTGGNITVEIFPTGTSTTDCPSSQLSASKNTNPFPRHYFIYYVNRNGFVDNSGVWKWSVDCMAGSGTRLNAADGQSNEIWITSNGRSTTGGSSAPEGSRSYAVPGGQQANSATDRAGVCISDTGAGQGNQTPLQIVAV